MKKAFLYAILAYINGFLFIQTVSYWFLFAQIMFIIIAFKEFLNDSKN